MLPNACPKPRPKLKAPKALKKVNRARKKLDDERVYGPPARRKFVTLGPCAACGSTELCDNAHVLGNDGAGRKQGYKSIAPLCRPRLEAWGDASRGGIVTYEGCHAFSHRDPAGFRAKYPAFNPAKAARFTEKRWQSFLRGRTDNG